MSIDVEWTTETERRRAQLQKDRTTRSLEMMWNLNRETVPDLGDETQFPFRLTMNTVASVIQERMARQTGAPQTWVLTHGEDTRIVIPQKVIRAYSYKVIREAEKRMGEHFFCSEHGFVHYEHGARRISKPDCFNIPHGVGSFLIGPTFNTPHTDAVLITLPEDNIFGREFGYPHCIMHGAYSDSVPVSELAAGTPLAAVIMFEQAAQELRADYPNEPGLVSKIQQAFPTFVERWQIASGLKENRYLSDNPARVVLELWHDGRVMPAAVFTQKPNGSTRIPDWGGAYH